VKRHDSRQTTKRSSVTRGVWLRGGNRLKVLMTWLDSDSANASMMSNRTRFARSLTINPSLVSATTSEPMGNACACGTPHASCVTSRR
jgi:hypothetical protein